MNAIIWPEGCTPGTTGNYVSNEIIVAGMSAAEGEVTEYEPPTDGKPARVAWHGWVGGDAETRLDVHHAWLVEDLSGGRVRILSQETQIGKPAQELARTRPNHMLNVHQEWIDGLTCSTARWADS